MISPYGIYVSVTTGKFGNGEYAADDTQIVSDDTQILTDDTRMVADDTVTLSLFPDVGQKEKDEPGLIIAGPSVSVDITAGPRQSLSAHHDEYEDHVALTSQNEIFQEDILEQLDSVQTRHVTILDGADVETKALSDFINKLAFFEPRYLSEVVFVMQNEERLVALETQCQEAFTQAFKELDSRDGVTVSPEEFVPLLTRPVELSDVNEVKLTVSEHILSGFRKLAQAVIDSLISVKTEDEDVQPYGETT